MALIQKSFSDIITFSRSSNATRVGPTGVLEYAPHNLLTYSEQFDNAAWTKSNTTVTANAAAAPNGTVTADLVTANTSSSFGFLYSNNTASGVFTASVYAKQGTQRYIQFLSTATAAYWANFDLQDGLAYAGGTTSSVSIVSVGNGWYRCSMSVTDSSANPHVIGFATSLNSARAPSTTLTTNCYLWGAQLSVGPYALDYTPTTSAAVYGPRFDYDGSGVTIVEPVSRNLLTYSEQFDNAAWTKGSATVTANATAAPDGTVTADKLQEDSSNNAHQVFQGLILTAQTYTFSFYAKAAERTWVSIYFDPAFSAAYVNLSNGTVGTVPAGYSITVTSVGNGWYRIATTRTGTAATWYMVIETALGDGQRSYAGTTGSGIYIWGAQLEVGSTATAYMVSGATNGFRAVPVVSGSATARGLLVEESRTNLVTYSEQFDNVAWIKLNASVTANAATSPDGTVSADLLIPDTSSNQHGVYQSLGATAGVPYTQSVFAKAAGYNWLFMTEGNNVSAQASFNLATGVVGTVSGTGSPSATITALGNGWYRCTLTYTPIATSQNIQARAANADGGPTFAGNGTSGIYIWGAQLEAGSFATSLIPTLASTVTRSADVASVNTLSPWFNATEGTFYTESVTNAIGTSPASFVNTGSSDIIGLGYSGANQSRLYIETSGVTQANLAVSYSGSVVKEAAVYKLNDAQNCANGTLSSQDTSVTLPSINKLNIGYFPAALTYQNGWVRRLAYFPRRLSSAELQALTA